MMTAQGTLRRAARGLVKEMAADVPSPDRCVVTSAEDAPRFLSRIAAETQELYAQAAKVRDGGPDRRWALLHRLESESDQLSYIMARFRYAFGDGYRGYEFDQAAFRLREFRIRVVSTLDALATEEAIADLVKFASDHLPKDSDQALPASPPASSRRPAASRTRAGRLSIQEDK